jgi:hypothetical protein
MIKGVLCKAGCVFEPTTACSGAGVEACDARMVFEQCIIVLGGVSGIDDGVSRLAGCCTRLLARRSQPFGSGVRSARIAIVNIHILMSHTWLMFICDS